MVQTLSLMLVIFCILYATALPSDRIKRGFNDSGYGSERDGGYFDQRSNERDASVSHEHGEECNSGEKYDSGETSYGRGDYQQNQKHHGRHPR